MTQSKQLPAAPHSLCALQPVLPILLQGVLQVQLTAVPCFFIFPNELILPFLVEPLQSSHWSC